MKSLRKPGAAVLSIAFMIPAEGSGWVSTEIGKSIETLDREIKKLSKEMKRRQP